ncbi:MAG: DUF4040 domain-containing protein [SAR202 cluster bacterium]|nr:DUF4040 domain-containing protein [SAR202 cluster bacterium]
MAFLEIDLIAWLEIGLFVLLVVAAAVALQVRDLMAAVAALGAYSVFAAALLALFGAVDVSMTEISIGAVLTTVFFIAGIAHFKRRSVD